MTCREELLNCAKEIAREKGENRFTMRELLSRMQKNGTQYRVSTIRTHISSRMCADSPKHHAVKYNDFQRKSNGVYALLEGWRTD